MWVSLRKVHSFVWISCNVEEPYRFASIPVHTFIVPTIDQQQFGESLWWNPVTISWHTSQELPVTYTECCLDGRVPDSIACFPRAVLGFGVDRVYVVENIQSRWGTSLTDGFPDIKPSRFWFSSRVPSPSITSVGYQSVIWIRALLLVPFLTSKGLCTNPTARIPPSQ